MLAAAAIAADYSRILPESSPRLVDHNIISDLHLTSLLVNLLMNSLDALPSEAMNEYFAVLKEGGELDQTNIDRIMKHVSVKKIWRDTVTTTVSTTSYMLVLHLLEEAAGPSAVPSTTLGQLLLHDLPREAVFLQTVKEPTLPPVVNRCVSAARIWMAGTQAAVLPAVAMGLVQSVASLVHVGNALLTRHDDIQLRRALIQFNEEVAAAHKAGAEASKEGGEEGSALPQLIDVAAHMTKCSAFPQQAVAAGTAAKLARKGAAPAPDKLTVYEFVCSLDEVTLGAVGQALWHYVLLPACAKAVANAALCHTAAVGAAAGTLVWPGTGTTIGSVLAGLAL